MDDIQICNLALARIGVSLKIASLDERTKEAIEIKNVFSLVRERVLEAAPWPCARKIVALQKVGDQPYGYLHRYMYPSDCLAIRTVLPPVPAGQSAESLRQWIKTNPVRHEIQLDGDNHMTICTDQDGASLEYTLRITNPRLFSAKFVSAFGWALGAEVALPLAKSDYARNAAAQYEKELNEALAAALNEEKADAAPDSEFVRARL